MIRYSHVSLRIPCERDSSGRISSILGVEPTRIHFSEGLTRKDDRLVKDISYCWVLDSPRTDGDPTDRLSALADLIEPFSARLSDLRPDFNPWIDILFRTEPQHPHGITGEFDWFRKTPSLMRRFGAWDLTVSYETFWFDHPEWIARRERGFFARLADAFRGK